MRSYNNFWCCFNAQLCLSWMFPHHCHLFVCLHSVLQVVTIFTITNADFDNIQGELYQTTGHCLNLYIHCSYGCEMWYHSLMSFKVTYIWLMCLCLRVNQMFMSVPCLVFFERVSWSSYYLSFLHDFECRAFLSTSSEKRQAGESWSGWRRTRRGKGRRRRGSQRGGRRVHTGEPLCGKSKNELISGLYPRRESRSKEGRDGKSRSVEGKKKTPTWRLPPVPLLEKVKSLIATVIHWHFIIGEPICQ